MKKENLRKLITQIRKYDLIETFNNPEDFDKWLSNLNDKQIENFNNLSIDPSSIPFPKYLLINENLLDCNDYPNRINAMLKLTNGEGCWHLFDRLCSKNFLNSKNYYQDIDLISKADTARYALWVIDEDAFINSPYHTEDLKLIINAKDTKKDNEEDCNDSLVAEALACIAKSSCSIKSPYHQADMKLVATCGSENLQSVHSYPNHSVNLLALDVDSLKDKYHLENMQILAKSPLASLYLYKIMTTEEIIKGKYYRDEINALVNAKSKITARAIYNYIVNPDRVYDREFDDNEIFDFDYNYIWLTRGRNIKGNQNPNYLKYLNLLNKVDDKFVLYFETLLSDEELLASKYYEHDINFALTITDKDIFMDLYRIMLDISSLSSPYHINDLNLISKCTNKKTRDWLTAKATDEYSTTSPNHEYDMQYISKLDLNNIPKERLDLMHYYLFKRSGINHQHHTEILDDIYNGKPIKNYNIIADYLDRLEQQLDNPDIQAHNIEIESALNAININKPRNKVLSKMKNIFKKR